MKRSYMLTLDILYQASKYFALLGGLLCYPATAQSILVDGTTPTTVNGLNDCSGNCVITGGSRDGGGSGPNLFHSFSNFNVDSGATVTFSDPGVANIFSRVTGAGNDTTIDGTLEVDGAANLFLLNPNGIMFGDGASLDIQGSFLSTTAESILFPNDTQFGVVSSSLPSLLTINTPLGLQFGSAAPEPIEVQGDGHSLVYNPRTFTISRNTPTSGLSVPSGQTLALLGGDITLSGGNLTAEAGHIEVASLGSGTTVDIDTRSQSWLFDYAEANSFSDISLSQQSSVDVSGDNAGSLNLTGRQISLEGGSAAIAQVLTAGSGQIALRASERIDLTGVDFAPPTSQMPTGVYIEIAPAAIGDGQSQIMVDTPTLDLKDGGQIGIGMAGSGGAGSVDISAQFIRADGGSNTNPSSLFSGVLPVFGPPPGARGQGGNLTIHNTTTETEQLSLTNGAQLIVSTFGAGDAGNLYIEAKDIEVRGFNAGGPSSIVSASEVPSIPPLPAGSGDGGEVEIHTDRLTVAEGGQVSVSTNSNNPSGNLRIFANEAVELRGQTAQGRSGLFANGRIGSGAGGNIRVESPQVSVAEGATINVSNFASTAFGPPPGTGPAGDINIVDATIVAVRDGGLITADTVSGDRANIAIQSESIVLRETSNISTNATGTASGGNISLDATALIALENSDITANAVENFGGRVIISAQTILGTEFRSELTPESDITATSALGLAFSGTVEIRTPDVDPADGITTMPKNLLTQDQVVATCDQIGNRNTFVATGRGGLPENASQLLNSPSIWNDFRFLETPSAFPVGKSGVAEQNADNSRFSLSEGTNESINHQPSITEAQAVSIDNEGLVSLVAFSNASLDLRTAGSCLE